MHPSINVPITQELVYGALELEQTATGSYCDDYPRGPSPRVRVGYSPTR